MGALTRDVQQVLLLDGPAVLGWEQWRALEEGYGLGAIRALLEQAVSEGALPPQPLDVVAHLLLAAVDEAALFIANSPEPRTAKEQALEAVERLITGLTSPAPKSLARKSKRTT